MCYSDIRLVTKYFRQRECPTDTVKTKRPFGTFWTFALSKKRFILSRRSFFRVPDDTCIYYYCDTEMLSRMFSIEFSLTLCLVL